MKARRHKSIKPKIPPRLRKWLRRVRETFPLTPLGLVVLGGCSLALFYYGLHRLDLVLLVVGAVGLVVGTLGVLATTITSIVLWRSLKQRGPATGEIRLECGYPVDTGFSIAHPWYVPFVGIHWTWIDPGARVQQIKRKRRLHERITPMRRALTDRVVRQFEVSDIFGLARVVFPVEMERPVHFVPSVGSMKQMQVVRGMAGGEDISHPDGPPEGERVDMRSYQSGDPIRFILWKVFAKSRQVVVRTPERAIAPLRQTVAYLVAGQNDEPGAGAARVAVEAGCLGGDWLLGADGQGGAVRSKDDALCAISRSASTAAEQWGAGLKKFLSESTPGGKMGRALVFVPATPGPWIDNVVAAAATVSGQPGRVEFVICCDGVRRQGVVQGFDSLLRKPQEAADPSKLQPVTMAELRATVQGLARARCNVVVINRVTGQVFSEGLLHNYLRAA